MATTDKTERLAMYFTTVDRYGTPYWEVRVMRIEDDPDDILPNGRPAPTARNLGGHALEDLVIRTWAYGSTTTEPKRELMTPHAEYIGASSVDMYRAERMLATLRKLDKALTKAYERDGAPAHLGQFMLRVARALGITEGIMRTDSNHRAQWLSEMRWRTISLPNLSDRIAANIQSYLDTGTQEQAA